MSTATCPNCRHDVIDTGTRLLNPDRSRLGRYLPDGTELTPRQQADTTIRGHHLHHCPLPSGNARDIDRVKKRHADIPQDPLPLDGFDPLEHQVEKVAPRAEPRSERWAKCPHHEPNRTAKRQLTGLYQAGPDEWVFREHTKKIGRLTLQCPGSGARYVPAEDA